jgi:glyoxylase-like metal-dependent hydrolase (beta-lactamase superfamily II)
VDGPDAALVYPFEPPAPGAVVEVADGVLWARMPVPFGPKHVNVYALADGDGWSVVDTGADAPEARALWSALLDGPLGGRPLRRVIVTHHHPDHIGLAGWLQAERGAELWTTRTSWLYARMLRLDERPTPAPEALAFWRGAGMPAEALAVRARTRPLNYADHVAPMPLGFRRIAQDDEIVAGGRRWRVEIGHGHAPEHATLWSRDDGVVIVGDQALPGITSNVGVYATEPEADTVTEWIVACRRLRARAIDPEALALPGHRRPYVGLAARLDALAADAEATSARLWAALATPRSAVACFDALYGRAIAPGEYGLALAEAMAHLNHLRARGLVRRETRADGAWLWSRLG